jgi:hypothetical protein
MHFQIVSVEDMPRCMALETVSCIISPPIQSSRTTMTSVIDLPCDRYVMLFQTIFCIL